MNVKEVFAQAIYKQTEISLEQIYRLIEVPKHPSLGDLAFPCFLLAKTWKKSPASIAEQIAQSITEDCFSKVEANGPYVNGFIHRESFTISVLNQILYERENYGTLSDGAGKTIVIDFSSPNIAKPFSMGHLRSTVIGNALSNIAQKCGYNAVKINHLGDWGTQFGKLMAAFKHWGDEDKVRKQPIAELFTLYTKFHEEAEIHPQLIDEGRQWFKKLEDGDSEAVYLWKWFREESLKEFSKIYQLLNISFDSFAGEAFYNDKMGETIEKLQGQNLLEVSDGAEVVDLTDVSLPPCLIKKSDGATLYATRDLTAALYRQEHYQFSKALYVVGHEQSVHFQQVFAVLEKMGYPWAKSMIHVPFGLYLQNGKKMSTRKGRVILLENVLQETIRLAEQNIEQKNPTLENKKEVAKQVGVGAVIFHDLKNYRMNNIEFSLEQMLTFEGETGPYVQYTFARACSILQKGNWNINSNFSLKKLATNDVVNDDSWELIKLLFSFSNQVQQAFIQLDPSIIAKYTVDVAKCFNKYYSKVKILTNNNGLQERLALVYAVTVVLKNGLQLIGVDAPKSM
ncbi:arginine--tRNA ligase [Caldibacillus lycopersici]|uniref:Arginine--tRNA ligase n=1 Tax=Perspicuibacillus lycopersici TaxID=1325689 RepID=A0AAE3LNV3_9BACI|nr:arginine--tRNA ligase [Perspicuibacillus lycopersici]MCU9615145.1 arginine--tRNA ligase [Perspicuibacillus lycopersici]